jgi:hypothetical protein
MAHPLAVFPTPSLGSARVYQTLGWPCRCVVHHNSGRVGDGLIPPPPRGSPQRPLDLRLWLCNMSVGLVPSRGPLPCRCPGRSWLAMRELVSLGVEFALLPSGSPLPHGPTIFPVEFTTSASLCCLTTSFSTPPSVFPPSI